MSLIISETIEGDTSAAETQSTAAEHIAEAVEEIKAELNVQLDEITENESEPKWPEIQTQIAQAVQPIHENQLKQSEELGQMKLLLMGITSTIAELAVSRTPMSESNLESVAEAVPSVEPEPEQLPEPEAETLPEVMQEASRGRWL